MPAKDNTIGLNIKTKMKESGMKLETLSTLTGLSISFLSDIRTGRTNPSLETLKKIANALNTSASELIGEIEVYADEWTTPNGGFLKKVTPNGVDVYYVPVEVSEKDSIENVKEQLKKIQLTKKIEALKEREQNVVSNIFPSSADTKLYMCPVYGRISAGQPNWAEECIEGRLPLDPELMNIHNPEECFFLRVSGESMNKIIKNGAYALIHKQEEVENGEIAVVLVNGYDATLKKFTKKDNMVVLEPMSDDPSFEIQLYGPDTPIQILGKYIGKFEMN